MEWHQVTERTGYFYTDFVSIPVYHLTEKNVVFIDTGYRESEALIKEVLDRGLNVRAILNTHLHEDHVNANPQLQSIFGCPVYADRREEAYVKSLRAYHDQVGPGVIKILDEFVKGLEFEATYIEPGTASVTVDGSEFKVVPLPGHSGGHIGFITPDSVFCPGDALISENRLAYSKLPYHEDIEKALETFDKLKEIKCDKCIIAHNDVIDGSLLSRAAEANKETELRIEKTVMENYVPENSEDPDSYDLEQASGIADILGIHAKGIDRMWINNSVRDRIVYLRKQGLLT